MSRRNGREKVLANLEALMAALAVGLIERREFDRHVSGIVREHPWVGTERNVQTNVFLLEEIWARGLDISPVPGRIPVDLKKAA